jgi:hypothetical protein
MATRKSTQAAPAASVNDSPESITPSRTPGERACFYALSVDTILCAHASKEGGDLAWGLHWMAENASVLALDAIESGDIEAIEGASLRYAQTLAITDAICKQDDKELLTATVAMMEATKDMIDAEVCRLMAVERGAAHATPSI